VRDIEKIEHQGRCRFTFYDSLIESKLGSLIESKLDVEALRSRFLQKLSVWIRVQQQSLWSHWITSSSRLDFRVTLNLTWNILETTFQQAQFKFAEWKRLDN